MDKGLTAKEICAVEVYHYNTFNYYTNHSVCLCVAKYIMQYKMSDILKCNTAEC